MKPTMFDGVDVVLGAPVDWNSSEKGECMGLPIMRNDGTCTSRWSLSWRERFRILWTGAVYCHVVSGATQPAISLNVDEHLPRKWRVFVRGFFIGFTSFTGSWRNDR